MKTITLSLSLIFSIFFSSCDKLSKGNLPSAKTSQEAIQAISRIQYTLVEHLTSAKQKVKIEKPIYLKLIDKGLTKQNDAEIAINGKSATMGILTNLNGLVNEDENKPVPYTLQYYNENSTNSFGVLNGNVKCTIKGDSLFLTYTTNYNTFKFIKSK